MQHQRRGPKKNIINCTWKIYSQHKLSLWAFRTHNLPVLARKKILHNVLCMDTWLHTRVSRAAPIQNREKRRDKEALSLSHSLVHGRGNLNIAKQFHLFFDKRYAHASRITAQSKSKRGFFTLIIHVKFFRPIFILIQKILDMCNERSEGCTRTTSRLRNIWFF